MFAADGSDFSDPVSGIDVRLTKSINGDDGGTWAPSTAITIGGSGLRMIGLLLVSNNGTIQTDSGSRFVLGDNDWPALKPGHTGSSRTMENSFFCAASASAIVGLGGAQTTQVGQSLMTPLTSLQDGARFDQAVVTFKVASSHLPGLMPKMRVVRMNASGVMDPLSDTIAGADANGYFTIPTPATGALWFNAGASQTFTVPTNINRTIDKSQYTYALQVIEEDGSGALAGNTYYSVTVSVDQITDMRPY